MFFYSDRWRPLPHLLTDCWVLSSPHLVELMWEMFEWLWPLGSQDCPASWQSCYFWQITLNPLLLLHRFSSDLPRIYGNLGIILAGKTRISIDNGMVCCTKIDTNYLKMVLKAINMYDCICRIFAMIYWCWFISICRRRKFSDRGL